MKLTSSCEEDFLKWMCENYPEIRWHEYKTMPECTINALIVEFFDSVGIYVEINYDLNHSFDSYVDNEWIGESFKTRTEATNAGIIKANIIYNKSKSIK